MMDPIHVDVDAFMKQAESLMVQKLFRHTIHDKELSSSMCRVLDIFLRHGIGGVEAMEIITEIVEEGFNQEV